MVKRLVNFFEAPGVQNTKEVMHVVIQRAKEKDISAIVVASTSGVTAIKIAKALRKAMLDTKVVCVTGPPSWKKYGYEVPLIKGKERKNWKRLMLRQ